MGQPYIPLNESQQFAQDALDLMEFAVGNTSTFYGGLRAAMGQGTAFKLSRVEVGNEERLFAPGDYPGHYQLITSALWAQYPDLVIVASGRWGNVDATGNPVGIALN